MASKYVPLEQHLKSATGSEFPMSFSEIERVLGFELPASARQYPAWWSNNEGSHVAVKAWRNAGRKTARVDVPGEKVVFVRSPSEPPTPAPPSAATGRADDLRISMEDLPLVVRAALDRDGGGVEAALRLMEEGAMERRRRLLADIAMRAGPMGSSSVDLIREDRDAR